MKDYKDLEKIYYDAIFKTKQLEEWKILTSCKKEKVRKFEFDRDGNVISKKEAYQ